MSEVPPNEAPQSEWHVDGNWNATLLMNDWLVHANKSYRVCIRHAFIEDEMNRAFKDNVQLPETFTHHALVGNCYNCMRTGFVGMRCKCHTGETSGGTSGYIVTLNGQQI